jgi:hypothetical protein
MDPEISSRRLEGTGAASGFVSLAQNVRAGGSFRQSCPEHGRELNGRSRSGLGGGSRTRCSGFGLNSGLMTPRGAVHTIPEGDEVVGAREQRDNQHEPDRDVCNQIDSDDEAEEIPLIPSVSENCGDHGNNLQNHLQLTQVTCLNRKAFRRSYAAESSDQELASQYQNHDPGGHEVGRETNQQDEARGDQEFICHRIQQNSHAANLAMLAGQIAIKPVGYRGKDKDSGSQEFLLTPRKDAGGQNPYKKRDAANSA